MNFTEFREKEIIKLTKLIVITVEETRKLNEMYEHYYNLDFDLGMEYYINTIQYQLDYACDLSYKITEYIIDNIYYSCSKNNTFFGLSLEDQIWSYFCDSDIEDKNFISELRSELLKYLVNDNFTYKILLRKQGI